MRNKKKIIVIGTGFTSLISTLSLIKKGFCPIVLDIGTSHIKKKGYYSYIKPYFYNKKIEDYSFFGGNSEVWKGIIGSPTKSDLNNLFLGNKEKLLDCILKLIKNYTFFTNAISSSKKNQFKLFKLQNKEAKNILFREKTWVGKPVFFCKKIKNKMIPFQTKIFFKNLIKKKKIKFINGKVIKVISKKNERSLLYKNKDNVSIKLAYDYIFCAAGALSSAEIIHNSLNLNKRPIIFNNTLKGLFLSISKEKITINSNNIHPIYQGIIYDKRKTKIYIQSYLLSQIIYNLIPKIFRRVFNLFLSLDFFKKLIITYISTNKNSQFEVYDNSKIKSQKNNISKKSIKKIFKRINKCQSFFSILPIGGFFPSYFGNHFGSIFSNQKRKIKFSKRMGAINKLKNFYLVDISSINKILCIPPTLINMMHSYRITNEIINKKIIY